MRAEDKKTRTIRLTPDVDQRLEALCQHLGTNVNAFLITKIGEIVSTSELAFISKNNSNDMLSQVTSFMSSLQESIDENSINQEKQLPLDKDL